MGVAMAAEAFFLLVLIACLFFGVQDKKFKKYTKEGLLFVTGRGEPF
jgi:hypothetical protein